jgi:ribosomal protein S27AE
MSPLSEHERSMKRRTEVSPMHMTYFMMNWDKEKQTSSNQKCSQCGKTMNLAEQSIDYRGKEYVGYVCHTDKRLIWVKAG